MKPWAHFSSVLLLYRVSKLLVHCHTFTLLYYNVVIWNAKTGYNKPLTQRLLLVSDMYQTYIIQRLISTSLELVGVAMCTILWSTTFIETQKFLDLKNGRPIHSAVFIRHFHIHIDKSKVYTFNISCFDVLLCNAQCCRLRNLFKRLN